MPGVAAGGCVQLAKPPVNRGRRLHRELLGDDGSGDGIEVGSGGAQVEPVRSVPVHDAGQNGVGPAQVAEGRAVKSGSVRSRLFHRLGGGNSLLEMVYYED